MKPCGITGSSNIKKLLRNPPCYLNEYYFPKITAHLSISRSISKSVYRNMSVQLKVLKVGPLVPRSVVRVQNPSALHALEKDKGGLKSQSKA